MHVGYEASHIVLSLCVDHTELPRDSRTVLTIIQLPEHYEVGMKCLTNIKNCSDTGHCTVRVITLFEYGTTNNHTQQDMVPPRCIKA